MGTLISALGHPAEPPLSIAQALVRHPQLRRGGTSGLRKGALSARQMLRGPRANRQALRNLQQCQGKNRSDVQSGASGCETGLVKCVFFLKVPLACLGSTATAVQPISLWNSQEHFTKPFAQPDAPDCIKCSIYLGFTSLILSSLGRTCVLSPDRQ